MKQTAFVRASAVATTTPRGGLPVDLQLEAVRRLGIFALVSGTGALAALFLPSVLPGFGLLGTPIRAAVLLPFVATAWTLAWIARRGKLPPARVLDLALGFQVLGAAVIATASTPRTWPIEHGAPQWSPVAVFLMLTPVIIPSTTRRTLLVGFVSALMDPLAVAALVSLGLVEAPSPIAAVRRFGPTVAAVLLSTFVARLVHRLGDQIRLAREMGSYRLVERLGAGGMGEVWRASHRMLSRDAAVKLIRPDVLAGTDDPAVREHVRARFAREAQAIAALRSPHTVQLYDYGSTADGTLYFVMELLEGYDLETLIAEQGPLPPERVVHVLRQACRSLREAHEAGLVHRDVKPANLFLCKHGSEVDHLKVLDFGLVAERRHRDGGPDGERMVVGTPAYLAPESIAGGRELDGRTDLYALGCVAYYLLTGQTVFEAETISQMALQHLTVEPEPPSSRAELAVPPDLDALVLACLAKSPEARPTSMAELDRRLSAIRLDEPWTEERARSWWSSRGRG